MTSSSARQGRLPIAGEELARSGTRAAAAGTGDFDLGVEREQVGHAVGRRRGVAEIAGDRAAVLDLHAADFARGQLQAVEQRRQVGRDQLAPGGECADAASDPLCSAMPRSSASRLMSSTSLWRMSPQPTRAAFAG